ncbi:MAG: hypothetical protein Kow0068_16270 [Marinilabiliales bacterium]
MRIPFVILLIVSQYVLLFGQYEPDSINHKKYKYYRERFVNAFVYVSKEPGGSCPLSIREKNGKANFGADCTCELGWYIGVLGTEILYNYKNNTDYSDAVKELWHALYAINRFDIRADEIYNSPEENYLNGFIIRADVETGFIENNPEVNNHFNQKDENGKLKYSLYEVNHTHSMLQRFMDNPEKKYLSPEVSHDQFWSMLLGLFIAIKSLDQLPPQYYMENGQILYFQDSVADINQEAKNIVQRITGYLNKDKFMLYNPGTGKKVHTGCNAIVFKKPTLTACNIFTGTNYKIRGIGWQVLKRFYIHLEEFKSLANAAYSDSWKDWFGRNVTTKHLKRKSLKYNMPIFILIHQFLFDYDYPYDYDFLKLISCAPYRGPYNDGTFAHVEWSSTQRFEHTRRIGLTHSPFPGDYNGLDYMLLHNLYYLLEMRK